MNMCETFVIHADNETWSHDICSGREGGECRESEKTHPPPRPRSSRLSSCLSRSYRSRSSRRSSRGGPRSSRGGPRSSRPRSSRGGPRSSLRPSRPRSSRRSYSRLSPMVLCAACAAVLCASCAPCAVRRAVWPVGGDVNVWTTPRPPQTRRGPGRNLEMDGRLSPARLCLFQ